MDVDSDNELLTTAAAGGSLPRGVWPDLRVDIIARLEKIAREEFPIPKLPPPPSIQLPEVDSQGRLVSPLPSSPPEQPQSQDGAAEKTEEDSTAPNEQNHAGAESATAAQDVPPGQLPKQLEDMLTAITTHLKTFQAHPPHTIQRLSELLLRPRAHYKAVAPYLHAVDRVVMVTSGADTYPLPQDIGSNADPAASVAWGNPASGALGTDEALGGALLTPIPWVASNRVTSPDSSGGDSATTTSASASGSEQGSAAQIHSESTEKIDGPNGMGSIETVSVSVNGVHSTGHTRGITQGELLRQEQRAGVVPVNQLSRPNESLDGSERRRFGGPSMNDEEDEGEEGQNEDDDEEEEEDEEEDEEEEEEEEPHARGPDEIGVGDTGPQGVSTSYIGERGLQSQSIDVEAAVGRRHEEKEEESSSPASSSSGTVEASGTKREAEPGLENDQAKKVKEDEHTEEDGDVEMENK